MSFLGVDSNRAFVAVNLRCDFVVFRLVHFHLSPAFFNNDPDPIVTNLTPHANGVSPVSVDWLV